MTTGADMAVSGASGPTHQRMASDIWSVADLLRGNFMRFQYGEIILPLTVLRRLDAVMTPTRQAVRERDEALASAGMQNRERPLMLAAKLPFYNTSKQDFSTIGSDAAFVAKNLRDYIAGFSDNVRKIIERFDLDNQITRLAEARILHQVIGQFAALRDLEKLSTHDMGYVFEHLIRKFYEDAWPSLTPLSEQCVSSFQLSLLMNDETRFGQVADDRLDDIVAENAERNTEFMKLYFDNDEFRKAVKEAARRRAYKIITDPLREEAMARLRAEMERETGDSDR